MDSDALHDRWHRAARWLDASPAELAGLVVLLGGALAVVGLLWWTGRPVEVGMDRAVGGAVPTSVTTEGELVGADAVTVHVAGAVARPGLVRLAVGARVAEALEGAGGLLLDADPDALNLARPVTDGERLDVPRLGDGGGGGSGVGEGADTGSAVRPDGTLDLNFATAAELEELPGVGPVTANRILEWREANGPFTEVGQLREVSGIGEKTFQGLADRVAV